MQPLGLCNSGKEIFLLYAVIKVKVWWIHFSPPEELQNVLFDCLLAVIHCDLWSKPSSSSFFCCPNRCLKHPRQEYWEHQITNTVQQMWVLEHDYLCSNSNSGTHMAPRYSLKTVHHVSIHAWQTRHSWGLNVTNFKGLTPMLLTLFISIYLSVFRC